MTLASSMVKSGGSAELEGRMLRLARVVRHLEARESELDSVLAGMESFTQFAMDNLVGSQRDAVSEAIRTFIDRVKAHKGRR